MTSPPPSTGTSLPAASPRHPRQDHLLKRSGTARPLTPLVGALPLLWLLAGLALYAAHQLHDVNAAAATTQDRVVLLSEIRWLSRSLQRDALNLVSEDEPAELPVMLRKFASRSRTTRADLRTLHREVRSAERAASKVADAAIESLTACTDTLRTDAESVELRVGHRLTAAALLLTASGLVAGLIITRRSVSSMRWCGG